jgi:hypothetical protein
MAFKTQIFNADLKKKISGGLRGIPPPTPFQRCADPKNLDPRIIRIRKLWIRGGTASASNSASRVRG